MRRILIAGGVAVAAACALYWAMVLCQPPRWDFRPNESLRAYFRGVSPADVDSITFQFGRFGLVTRDQGVIGRTLAALRNAEYVPGTFEPGYYQGELVVRFVDSARGGAVRLGLTRGGPELDYGRDFCRELDEVGQLIADGRAPELQAMAPLVTQVIISKPPGWNGRGFTDRPTPLLSVSDAPNVKRALDGMLAIGGRGIVLCADDVQQVQITLVLAGGQRKEFEYALAVDDVAPYPYPFSEVIARYGR